MCEARKRYGFRFETRENFRMLIQSFWYGSHSSTIAFPARSSTAMRNIWNSKITMLAGWMICSVEKTKVREQVGKQCVGDCRIRRWFQVSRKERRGQAWGNFDSVPHEFLILRFESMCFKVVQLKHCRVVQAKKAKWVVADCFICRTNGNGVAIRLGSQSKNQSGFFWELYGSLHK